MTTSSLTFVRNVAERMYVTLDSGVGVTYVKLGDVQDIITGTSISVLDPTTLTPLVLPYDLTVSPANPRVWYTQEVLFEDAGDYICEFATNLVSDIVVGLEVSSEGSLAAPSLSVCTISGTIADGQGQPLQNVGVSARILAPPLILSTAGISTDVIHVVTDSNGFFQFDVLRSVTIDVIITEISYRRELSVPNSATASLFSIP